MLCARRATGRASAPQVVVHGGNVFHGYLKNNPDKIDIHEVYFSTIRENQIRGWKMHKKMTLNIIVPVGEIKFVLFKDAKEFSVETDFEEFFLSRSNYKRLTVPPNFWMGFQCKSEEDAMLLNIADIEHDPTEVKNMEINEIDYDWGN